VEGRESRVGNVRLVSRASTFPSGGLKLETGKLAMKDEMSDWMGLVE
jgi:hypothetical protein